VCDWVSSSSALDMLTEREERCHKSAGNYGGAGNRAGRRPHPPMSPSANGANGEPAPEERRPKRSRATANPPGAAVGTDAAEVARLVAAMPRIPMVTASGLGTQHPVIAALLAWGHHHRSGSWAAGISFVFKAFSGRPVIALVTVWLPGGQVQRRRSELYLDVPRLVLVGPPEQWPALPACYPHAGPEWTAAHEHHARADPAGRYGQRGREDSRPDRR